MTEFVKNVSKSRYGSPAKMYGRVTIDGETFVYHKPTDTLVRADLYHSYTGPGGSEHSCAHCDDQPGGCVICYNSQEIPQ